MAKSKLDSVYRRMLITRFFERGWGKPENLQRYIYMYVAVFVFSPHVLWG